MANIARFDPFFDVDDLFRDFRLAPVRRDDDAPKMKEATAFTLKFRA